MQLRNDTITEGPMNLKPTAQVQRKAFVFVAWEENPLPKEATRLEHSDMPDHAGTGRLRFALHKYIAEVQY